MKRMRIFKQVSRAVLLLAVLLLSNPGPVVSEVSVEVARPDAGAVEPPVVEGNTRFALELYAKLCGREGNLFFSPYSISTALAMTCAGARGGTEAQMSQVLHFPIVFSETTTPRRVKTAQDRERFAEAFGRIVKDLNDRGGKDAYDLTVANALWGQKGYGFLERYIGLIKKCYDGDLREVDFARATEDARKTINKWVEKKTGDKIKELIQKGVLDAMTRLVLTNAIYFKGNWQRRFEQARTHEAPFTLADGGEVSAAMMNQKARFGYMQTDRFQALELPYVDDELSMIIFLPGRFDGLGEFEKQLTKDNVSQWLAGFHKREVDVFVPKFKLTSRFSLADVLRSMGIKDAFDPRSADFSGISGRKDLFISAVIHKAYVDVNEEGTEAAAATGVVMKMTSALPEQTAVFRADHPFVFVIRDNKSGSFLFLGRIVDPNQ